MANQIKSESNLSNESSRREQPRSWFDNRMPKFKKAKSYDAETINSEIANLDKSRSMNGEEVAKLAKAAKERGKQDGFVAGLMIMGIAWGSNALANYVMKKFNEA